MSDLAEQIDALLALNAKGAVSHPVPGLAVELLTTAAEALRQLYAVALPDELEVVAWRYRPTHVPATAPWAYMDDREPSASFTADALVLRSQAHSTIAALRAERDEAVDAFKHLIVAMAQERLGVGDKEGGGLFIRNNRAETAEAEVQRLTEDNEALRAALEALVDQADHVTVGARTSADINKAARNLFPLCVAARAILTQENADG